MFDRLISTYQGKKVFLTGHTGFKGSWMLQLLHLLGATIKGYALSAQYPDDLYNLIGGDGLCHSVLADLRDRDRLISEITTFQPDYIFHLAAQPLVRYSYTNPTETFEVNALGTVNLLEAIRSLTTACKVVLITTDKVYQNKEWIYPYRETDRLGGHDPYSASKACSELIIDCYRDSFFAPEKDEFLFKSLAVARAGNVIGGGDWSTDRLFPDIVRFLSQSKEIIIRNPHSVRPWQHVMEPISGYLLLGTRLLESPREYASAYNFGPSNGDDLAVEKLVQKAIEAWGGGTYKVTRDHAQFHEAGLLRLDISKAVRELGWNPHWSSDDSIRKTVDWYKAFNENKLSIGEFTKNQIRQFFNLSGHES